MLKCAPAVPVPDCTERTNLRRYGTGDMFFSYRAKVCIAGSESVASSSQSSSRRSVTYVRRSSSAAAITLGNMPLDGGVGITNGY